MLSFRYKGDSRRAFWRLAELCQLLVLKSQGLRCSAPPGRLPLGPPGARTDPGPTMVVIECFIAGAFLSATGISCNRSEKDEERRRRETATIVSDTRQRLQADNDAAAERQRSPESSPPHRRSASDADLESLAHALVHSPTDVSAYEDEQDMKRLRKKYGLGESPRFPGSYYAPPTSPTRANSEHALSSPAWDSSLPLVGAR